MHSACYRLYSRTVILDLTRDLLHFRKLFKLIYSPYNLLTFSNPFVGFINSYTYNLPAIPLASSTYVMLNLFQHLTLCAYKLFQIPLFLSSLHYLSFIPFCLETKRNRKSSRQERWLRPLCRPTHNSQSLQASFSRYISVDNLNRNYTTNAFQKV
jgi:hypothetical protein